jgi:hypothetical protein
MQTYQFKRLLQTAAVFSALGMISAAQAAAIVVNLDVNESQTKLVPTHQVAYALRARCRSILT